MDATVATGAAAMMAIRYVGSVKKKCVNRYELQASYFGDLAKTLRGQ